MIYKWGTNKNGVLIGVKMKTSPFDLEKALAGAPVVTRDGCKVLALHKFDIDIPQPLVVFTDSSTTSMEYTLNGCFYEDNRNHNRDLLMLEPDDIKTKGLTFGEALVALKENKHVRRSWWPSRSNVYLYDGEELRVNTANGQNHAWAPNNQELLSEDWEIV